jgi:hypothetical protein
MSIVSQTGICWAEYDILGTRSWFIRCLVLVSNPTLYERYIQRSL